jgi:phenylacetate-CoA ligase
MTGLASSAVDRRYWDERSETMSRDELATLQAARLAELVQRLIDASEFYRGRLTASGIEAGDVRSPEDLASLPVVTKEELREEQERRPPFGGFVIGSLERWRELHPSTGTTGRPVKIVWSGSDVDTISDSTARTLWQFGVRPGDVIQNAFAYGLWVAGMSCHYAAGRIGCLVVPTGATTSTAKQIEFLQEVGSTVLLATPSYAIHIGEALREQGVDPSDLSLRLGCFGGEPGASNPPTRRRIELALGLDAFDYYGLAEIGPTFASECEAKAGLHFAEDHVLVECLDPESKEPVARGEPGVLVFTTLTREATPMLRYWSNDVARLETERCKCGRTHVRALGGIIGRRDDQLIFKGSKFYPQNVERVVRSFAELSDEFRIEVEREPSSLLARRCSVVVETTGNQEHELEARVRRALQGELGVAVGVRLEPFGTLERTTFKASRVVLVETRDGDLAR